MNQTDKSLDILGVKPIATAIETVTKASVDGLAALLSRICLPAAEEFGLLFRDRVSAWRANNAAAIAWRAEKMLPASQDAPELHAPPRIVAGVIEMGSWTDSEQIQQLWAGLLASACSPDGRDDSNWMFIDLLSKFTVSQARIFDYICVNSKKYLTPAGLLMARNLPMRAPKLFDVSGLCDLHRLDLELDHMRTLGLLEPLDGGFSSSSSAGNLTPTGLALNMFARCQGHFGQPLEFYGLKSRQVREPPGQ